MNTHTADALTHLSLAADALGRAADVDPCCSTARALDVARDDVKAVHARVVDRADDETREASR